jgi:S1-C subfamily serine protease
MQVCRVYAGSAAEQAGLQVGDVILAANGYLMEQHGNLAWAIANAAPDGILSLTVHSALDGQTRRITARVP